MQTKDDLIQNVKTWIELYREIKHLQAQVKEKNKVLKQLSDSLIQTMKSNEIDTLNTSELQLCCVQKETKSSLSKKYLEKVLLEYFDNNSQQASELQEYILNNRTITTKDTLKTNKLS
tara:strand:+ start:114 stop:467 length:354 start_codon:yes stop_codon:yes gene_type:complete